MIWQRIRIVLLAGALAAVAAHPALAADNDDQNQQNQKQEKKQEKKQEATPAHGAQKFCTIKVCECVPENYTCTRTVYKTQYRTEKFTAYKCVCVPEERNVTCTVYKNVPEVKTVTRTYCVCVPHCEQRTIQQPCYSYQQVTKMVTKCVDRGHYECREVPCHWKACLHKLRHCCNSCCCDCCPPPTRTVKVWCPCIVQVQCPVTCCVKVCTYKPVVCNVTVYKQETRTEQCQVTCCKCVPEVVTKKVCVMVNKQVAYEATRCVAVCVPCQETVTCCRMVTRVVEKQVPVCECTPCCQPCCAPCYIPCCRHHCCR